MSSKHHSGANQGGFLSINGLILGAVTAVTALLHGHPKLVIGVRIIGPIVLPAASYIRVRWSQYRSKKELREQAFFLSGAIFQLKKIERLTTAAPENFTMTKTMIGSTIIAMELALTRLHESDLAKAISPFIV